MEIEVLDRLKSARLLDSVIFGGGTMLRLCHEMNRYSADLDFWLKKKLPEEKFFSDLQNALRQEYEISDAQLKPFTILVEVRSARYPRKLKLEIGREIRDWDFEEKIAYSRFSTKQVSLKGHTLLQTLENKISALGDRGEIRDAFDMEFILRQGLSLPALAPSQKRDLIKQLDKFKPRDFQVTLGSLLPEEIRQYYVENHFRFLRQKLEQA